MPRSLRGLVQHSNRMHSETSQTSTTTGASHSSQTDPRCKTDQLECSTPFFRVAVSRICGRIAPGCLGTYVSHLVPKSWNICLSSCSEVLEHQVSHLVRKSWNSKSLILFRSLGTASLSSCSDVLECMSLILFECLGTAKSLILRVRMSWNLSLSSCSNVLEQ